MDLATALLQDRRDAGDVLSQLPPQFFAQRLWQHGHLLKTGDSMFKDRIRDLPVPIIGLLQTC
ncbi:hypothetical protein D3C81_1346020 [compost metagenome]